MKVKNGSVNWKENMSVTRSFPLHIARELTPDLRREVVLRNGNANGASSPGDPHDLHKVSLDSQTDLVDAASAVDVGHAGQVDQVGNDGRGQVRSDDLHDLVSRCRLSCKGTLEGA